MRLLVAHIDLLKAELAVTGHDLGIIAALGIGAISLVLVALLLIAIGTFLFVGEWLFGSMAWGILHGTSVPGAVGRAHRHRPGRRLVGAWVRGVAIGLVTTLLLWVLFASNVLRDAAVQRGRVAGVERPPRARPAAHARGPGRRAVLLGVVLAIVGSRRTMGVRLGLDRACSLGAIVGAILGSVTFDTSGALAVALHHRARDRPSWPPSLFAVASRLRPGAPLLAARAPGVHRDGGGDQAISRAPVASAATKGGGQVSDTTRPPADPQAAIAAAERDLLLHRRPMTPEVARARKQVLRTRTTPSRRTSTPSRTRRTRPSTSRPRSGATPSSPWPWPAAPASCCWAVRDASSGRPRRGSSPSDRTRMRAAARRGRAHPAALGRVGRAGCPGGPGGRLRGLPAAQGSPAGAALGDHVLLAHLRRAARAARHGGCPAPRRAVVRRGPIPRPEAIVAAAVTPGRWCGRGDSNPHASRHWLLRPACLPFHHSRVGGV